MADLIDRQAAIDAVRSYYDECDEREESIEERIERLPSADIDLSGFSDKLWQTAYERGKAEAVRWIPCGERLPENRLYVLVTYKYEYGLIDHGITWYGQVEGKWNTSREVIAWMPLPEPYKDGEQDG